VEEVNGMVIVKRGRKFIVLSRIGRTLGTHKTRAGALRQLGAIEASMARARKRRRR